MSDVNKKDSPLSDTDDFWSLDSMLPPTERVCFSPSVKNDVTLAEIELGGENAEERTERIPKRENAPQYAPITAKNGSAISDGTFERWLESRISLDKSRASYGKRVVLEYAPGGRYVKKVTVSEETGARAGGERFILDGKRLLGLRGEFRGNVPFESFYPQYSQLNESQCACYIAFRTEVKSGRFPEVSRSYIYLYLYELINLSEESPSERAEMIASLICGYPECDRKLFSDMCRWLSDLCLIHRIKIPESVYGEVFSRVLECTDNKEIFLDLGHASRDESSMLVLSLSRYDYRKSKFYGEFSEYYDKFIPEAVIGETEKLSKTDTRFSDIGRETCTLTRESYFGAFCTSAVRRTVAVEICCITGDEYVIRTVTDTVKYAENRLRAELMIKPRLSVVYLPIAIRDGIKSFFAERRGLFPRRREVRRYEKTVEALPEYESLYEPSEKGISEEAAREIEKSSWDITERLVTAFDGEELYEPAAPSDKEEDASGGMGEALSVNGEKGASASENVVTQAENSVNTALRMLLCGDDEGVKRLIKDSGYLPHAFADMINEQLYDLIGDSAVGMGEDGISIIEDYIDDIKDIVGGNA